MWNVEIGICTLTWIYGSFILVIPIGKSNNRFPELEFHEVCNIRCKNISSLVRGTTRQWAVWHAVYNHNGICHAYDTGSTRCSGTIKNGACSAFGFLYAALRRVPIILVSLRFLAPYPIGPENLAQTTHKLFLWIIRPDIDRNAMFEEEVLKKLGNIEARLRSYLIYFGRVMSWCRQWVQWL